MTRSELQRRLDAAQTTLRDAHLERRRVYYRLRKIRGGSTEELYALVARRDELTRTMQSLRKQIPELKRWLDGHWCENG